MSKAAKGGKAMLLFGFALPLIAYGLIVFGAPLDVFDQMPIAKAWADRVREALLRAGRVDIYTHARSTAFPQVAMLASSLAVVIVAVIASACIWQSMRHFDEVSGPLRGTNKGAKDVIGSLVVLPLLGLFAVWAFFCLKGDPSFAAGLTTQTRLGYFLIASIAIVLAGAGIGLWPVHVRLLCSSSSSGEKA